MNITKRYIHPQEQAIQDAMGKARSAASGHSLLLPEKTPVDTQSSIELKELEFSGAPGVIRTHGLLVRSQTLYPAELRAH